MGSSVPPLRTMVALERADGPSRGRSRRRSGVRLRRAAGQVLVFACGAGALLLWRDRLYASATLAAVAALWIAADALFGPAFLEPPRPLAKSPDFADMERRLRQLRAVLEEVPSPLLELRAGAPPSALNRAARSLFQTDERLVEPPTSLLAALAAAGSGAAGSVRLQTRQGSHAFAVSVTDAAGVEGRIRLAALTDIEPRIREAEAAALRELLQILGHEIMNSLTPVASLAGTAATLLREEGPEGVQQALDAVETLGRRAAGLSRFVDGYRALAGVPPPALAPTRLAALVEDVGRLFTARWGPLGVGLHIDPPPAELTVRLDAELITQALLDVLANAAEAALAGGRSPPMVRVTARAAGDGLELTVRDNGAGLGGLDRESLFKPFFTTKPSGTGVGLSLARQIARSHGGEVFLLPDQAGAGAGVRIEI